MKHYTSPEPWQGGQQEMRNALWDAVFDKNGDLVALINNDDLHLIMAAPDLRTSVTELLAAVAGVRGVDPAVLRRARKALARANDAEE